MKTTFKICAMIVAFTVTTLGTAQEKKASPVETATGKINGANVTVNYGSPSVKGREIWGKLVPFNEVWRAGANEATTFETDKELTIEGQKLPAGKYSFFVIPNKDEAIVIFNKEFKQWGSYDYDQKKDQIRVKVKPQAVASSTEKLVYTINKDNLTLSWEKWNIPVKMK